VVKEVVRHVVAGVSKDTTAVSSRSRVPVPADDSVCELPERRSQDNKKCRRHDQPVLVHGKIVVNAVEKEMESEADAIIGQMPVEISAELSVRRCTYSSK
jgi:hypothetical protein